jgi:hypothetical protein
MSPAPAAAARHRTGVRRGAATRVPRRVSGPARPRAVHGGAAALPRPHARPRPATRPAPSVARRALRRLAALPEHRALDRLLTGSGWIVLVGFALIGIVFMQVSLLKLNAGIGHAVERAATLERQNSQLRDEVSRLGSNDRLQAEADRLGLVLPPAGAVTFLGQDGKRIGGDASAALAAATAVESGTPGHETEPAIAPAETATPATDPAAAPAQPQQAAAPPATATAPAAPAQPQQRPAGPRRPRAPSRRPSSRDGGSDRRPAEHRMSTPLGPASTCP